MVKDIGIALELATREELSLPLSDLGRRLWTAAQSYSPEGASISDMVRWVELMTGTEITPVAAP